MMISDKLAEAMSLQVGREMAASNQYIVIAAYFEREMLDKLAGFFYRQAAEEHEHAMKFVHYVTGAGGKVALPAVTRSRTCGGAGPATGWATASGRSRTSAPRWESTPTTWMPRTPSSASAPPLEAGFGRAGVRLSRDPAPSFAQGACP